LLAESAEELFQYAYVIYESITGADGKAGSVISASYWPSTGICHHRIELLNDLYSKVLH
jgi:hypothetical protein